MRPLNSRREFLRMIGFGSAAATALAACAPVAPATTPIPASAPAAPTAPAVSSGPAEARIGYLPITDAAPLLLAHARGLYAEAGLQVQKPTLLRSWAQVVEAFQARQVDVVHVLMPMAVWMRFGQNFPVKLVAWDHTDGSALTVANNINSLDDLAGKTVAVPFWYSIHNLVLQLLLRKANLKPILKGDPSAADRTIKLVVMAPADMPPAIGNGSIAGYIVADPFNAVAEVNKVGKVHRFTGDIWLNHACCVVVMHEDDTVRRPDWAQKIVTSVARAQIYARENRAEAAKLLSKEGGDYLPQPLPVIARAMTHYDLAEYGASGAVKHPDWKNHRIDFQPFPFPSYTEELVRLLKETEVEGDVGFLKGLDPAAAHATLVDDRFAREAIRVVGGPAKFGIAESLSRSERIEA
ncbi:MAG: ABC transporter substrate-binding protein [Chloroflexi bacterium]|nr:ABC transporter substrate-binding protein [Chloroflexota bacterium]